MQNQRQELADAYHIISDMGLDDSTYAHISKRVDAEHFLILPFGMLFDEVTPESLLLVHLSGTVIEGTEQHYNQTGYAIHSSVYKAREDVNAIFHLHTEASIAVASSPTGLLPLSQWALHFYKKVAYGTYDSLILDSEQQGCKLTLELGNKNVMLMQNHGLLTCGKTLAEALYYVHHLERACKVQAFSHPPKEGWVLPDHATCVRSCQDLLGFEKDLGRRDWNAYVRRLRRNKLNIQDLIKCKIQD